MNYSRTLQYLHLTKRLSKMCLIGSLELWVNVLNLLLQEIKEGVFKMETKDFFEGFEAALNLFDIEIAKHLDGAMRRDVDGLLDAKNISTQLRSMMLNGEDIFPTQDQERFGTHL